MNSQILPNVKLKFYNFETKTYFETVYSPRNKKYSLAEASQTATEMLDDTKELFGAFILGLQPVAADPTYPNLIAVDTNI